jgi:hypothetical protein
MPVAHNKLMKVMPSTKAKNLLPDAANGSISAMSTNNPMMVLECNFIV